LSTYEGILKALSANNKHGWKGSEPNTLAYFATPSVTKKKSLITLIPVVNVPKLFSLLLMLQADKLECLPMTVLSSLVEYFK
jgi:hypothetical protein